MPDAFNDAMKVIKSHIPTANALTRIDVSVGQNKVVANDSSGARLKRGRSPVATEIILSDDIEPRSVDECKQRQDWPKWKDAIQAELNSLERRNVFGPVVQTPSSVNLMDYKWVFTRKRNEKNEIARYKA
ncbi:hypothetical protein ACFX2J_043936 [Malus domestica]